MWLLRGASSAFQQLDVFDIALCFEIGESELQRAQIVAGKQCKLGLVPRFGTGTCRASCRVSREQAGSLCSRVGSLQRSGGHDALQGKAIVDGIHRQQFQGFCRSIVSTKPARVGDSRAHVIRLEFACLPKKITCGSITARRRDFGRQQQRIACDRVGAGGQSLEQAPGTGGVALPLCQAGPAERGLPLIQEHECCAVAPGCTQSSLGEVQMRPHRVRACALRLSRDQSIEQQPGRAKSMLMLREPRLGKRDMGPGIGWQGIELLLQSSRQAGVAGAGNLCHRATQRFGAVDADISLTPGRIARRYAREHQRIVVRNKNRWSLRTCEARTEQKCDQVDGTGLVTDPQGRN